MAYYLFYGTYISFQNISAPKNLLNNGFVKCTKIYERCMSGANTNCTSQEGWSCSIKMRFLSLLTKRILTFILEDKTSKKEPQTSRQIISLCLMWHHPQPLKIRGKIQNRSRKCAYIYEKVHHEQLSAKDIPLIKKNLRHIQGRSKTESRVTQFHRNDKFDPSSQPTVRPRLLPNSSKSGNFRSDRTTNWRRFCLNVSRKPSLHSPISGRSSSQSGRHGFWRIPGNK